MLHNLDSLNKQIIRLVPTIICFLSLFILFIFLVTIPRPTFSLVWPLSFFIFTVVLIIIVRILTTKACQILINENFIELKNFSTISKIEKQNIESVDFDHKLYSRGTFGDPRPFNYVTIFVINKNGNKIKGGYIGENYSKKKNKSKIFILIQDLKKSGYKVSGKNINALEMGIS